ncbi:MAG: hypothetical protein KC944_05940 [Candidatus Omnitrophica bacterium]|nr:hypothetical protein [Candidatus Omnitrophota bacterium]
MVYLFQRLVLGVLLIAVLHSWSAPAFISFEEPPIDYSKTEPTDPVFQLAKRIENSEVELEYDSDKGYLPSILKLLNIPVSSQALVFSKTSFQAPYISRKKPRALYFNDDVYIGWVQNGDVVEISSVDPDLGAVFYTLDQNPGIEPKFQRQTDACLQCHSSPLTQSVPGHLFRSVFTDSNGNPILNAGTFVTTQNSPMRERWGGWYVTGRHGDQRHMGNVFLAHGNNPLDLPVEQGANVTKLDTLIDTSPYLSPHSDLVALMVFEHQTTMHNLITQANYQARVALAIQEELNEMEGKPSDEMSPGTLKRFSYAAEPLLKHLLFAEEATLEGPVKGTSGFADEFQSVGPRDSKGRSLRDFDLRTRMFKHPCSFLIYSESFDHLPDRFRGYFYRRLWEILTDTKAPSEDNQLSKSDRRAVLEILLETKLGLPDYWKESTPFN